MRHESKFAAWISSGGNSIFVFPLGPVQAPAVKFSVVPDRLLDSMIDDASGAGVARLMGFLPCGVSIDITLVDLTAIKDQLRISVAGRLSETGLPVNLNDPIINAILTRYAEVLSVSRMSSVRCFRKGGVGPRRDDLIVVPACSATKGFQRPRGATHYGPGCGRGARGRVATNRNRWGTCPLTKPHAPAASASLPRPPYPGCLMTGFDPNVRIGRWSEV